MADEELRKEFEPCRQLFQAEEEKHAFDQQIKQLLEEHGVDYVRGYVAALTDMMRRTIR
jgi:hypothetical protein